MAGVEFFSFFIVLLTAVFFSALFMRLHLPWALALIVGGIVIGPHGLELLVPNNTITFLSEIGLIFLMFMAGLEVKLSTFQKNIAEISFIGIVNGIVPFIVGFSLGIFFGFSGIVSLILGIIFISSSVAVIVPALESRKILGSSLGDAVIGTTIIQDVASLILLSVIFQKTSDLSMLPLPLFYILLLIFLVALRWALPKIENLLAKAGLFYQELRVIFVILVGTVIVFELLGLHPIIAGFFTGFVLSDTVRTHETKEKLKMLSYGLFIPIFFVVVGTTTDISVLSGAISTLGLTLTIILGSILSKLTSGWLASRFAGFSKRDSALIAVSSVPQLSTTLAVAFSAGKMNLISEELVTILVLLSIVTTLITPLLLKYVLSQSVVKLKNI